MNDEERLCLHHFHFEITLKVAAEINQGIDNGSKAAPGKDFARS
jgi:hypothetical protein